MARPFHRATAEQVVSVVDAVYVNRRARRDLVERFCDLTEEQADGALSLAVDMRLLGETSGEYIPLDPLARFISVAPAEAASALRVVLESYEPFTVFRDRLGATNSADTAAQQTLAILDLATHREHVKDTLMNLGTYTGALRTEGGGRYRRGDQDIPNHLAALAGQADTVAASERAMQSQLGEAAAQRVSQQEVIRPLADALMKASAGSPRDAVTAAGNAVDSYLTELAARLGVNLAGATGINAKVEKLLAAGKLPKKLAQASKYIGHVRNAADHGIDAEIGAAWAILPETGLPYVYAACAFIRACDERERGGPFVI